MKDTAAVHLRLTRTRFQAGLWEGILDGAGAGTPQLEVFHRDRALGGLAVTPDPAQPTRYRVSFPVPADLLSDGVQTILIRDADSGEALDSLTIVAGLAPEDDIRAEMDLLRTELDLLKRAFRRHCRDTAGQTLVTPRPG